MTRGNVLPGRRVSKNELCGIFGVSPPTVDAWMNRGCPVEITGEGQRVYQFDTADVRRWREDYVMKEALKKALPEGQTGGDLTMDDAKKRKVIAEANMTEINLALKAGVAVSINDVVWQWKKIVANCRAKFLSLGSTVAAHVAAESDVTKCRKIIETAVYAALEELSTYDHKKKPPKELLDDA